MKVIKQIEQSEVFSHWEKVEKRSIYERIDIVFPIVAYNDLIWILAELEKEDIDNLYIISSDDWRQDRICIPDFKLKTAISNYKKSNYENDKYADIKRKEDIFKIDLNGLDTRLILVGDNKQGLFTIIEGNRRAVALGSLNKLLGLKVYIGVSSTIKNYIWSRYTYL